MATRNPLFKFTLGATLFIALPFLSFPCIARAETNISSEAESVQPAEPAAPSEPTNAIAPSEQETKVNQAMPDFPVSYVVQDGLIFMPISAKLSLNWAEAKAYCETSEIHGMTGWRLPTMPELKSLINSGAPKNKGWALNRTWSSTPHKSSDHLSIGMKLGFQSWTNDNLRLFVSCVYEFNPPE